MKVIKIIIAESSPIISSGLSSFFNDMNQIAVASIVDNIDDLQDKIIMHSPDVLIINPMMLGCMLNTFVKQMTQNYPNINRVALVTSYVDKNILKNFKEVVELNDNKQKVINKMLNLQNNNDETSAQNESVDLSNREVDVLVCVAKGMTNKDISDMLNISVHTVITHRKNIVKKTGIKSVSGLTVYALLNNLVEESEIYE
jgi:DNA-binding NarL/FixJ family response regulator